MPAERAGYTVTMFLIDISPSMGTMRSVDLPPGPNGEQQTVEMTHLEWALQFVKLKIQEMIFNGRKTDQCGIILFGSEETKNVVNNKNGGYDHVMEYINIGQPNAGTLSKIDALRPSEVCGDPIDALVVGIETQANYLSSKKTWTRKIVMVTDGESPIEIEDWETIAQKMDNLNVNLTLVGIDFDDEDFGFTEPDKSPIKKANEKFYHTFISALQNGVLGTCEEALQEIAKPDLKQVKSALLGTILRLGDVDSKMDEAIELTVKTSKCTALTRPPGWKKFALRDPVGKKAEENPSENMDVEGDNLDPTEATYAHLKMRSEYYVDRSEDADERDAEMEEDNDAMDTDQPENKAKNQHLEKVEDEQLVKGFKYGTTYAPCPEGQFPRLSTKKGIDLCGFFPAKNFRRELSMGEVQYIWADPGSAHQQVALSSIIQAMYEKNVMAIARWVTRDDMDPRMGVLAPVMFDEVDCLLWVQMPFADDVRKYTFASLDNLVSKKGEIISEHPYIPTEDQKEAMDEFVDIMDLMTTGEKDDEGNRQPWFDTLQSYNPAVHRIKQAMFHCAVVSDIATNPLPPPHPELAKYFDPPKRVVKNAQSATEKCKAAFKVRQVPKKAAKAHKGNHAHAEDEDDNLLLLDRKRPSSHAGRSQITETQATPTRQSPSRSKTITKANMSDSGTEDEEEEMLLDSVKKPTTPPTVERDRQPLPTPARSVSPDVDPGRAHGRIIGSTYPLADFKRNISQGDVVTKAVEDLSAVITEIVMRPFSSRRTQELLECMQAMRETSLDEDEIDAWNLFLTNLKDKCTSQPGNAEFWRQVHGSDHQLGLISDKEAKKHGGTSKISEAEAADFLN